MSPGDLLKGGAGPSKYLGRVVQDEYGRTVGRVAGFFNFLPDSEADTAPDRNFTLIVESSGSFRYIDTSMVIDFAKAIRAGETRVVVRSELKFALEDAKQKILWLRDRILALEASGVFGTNEDTPVLNAAHIQHKTRFNTLVNGVHLLLDKAQERTNELRAQSEIIERGLVDINIAFNRDEIDKDEFETYSTLLRQGLTSADLELSELEEYVRVLSQIERDYREVFKVEIVSGSPEKD